MLYVKIFIYWLHRDRYSCVALLDLVFSLSKSKECHSPGARYSLQAISCAETLIFS